MAHEWTGRHVLAALLLSFAVVVGINGYFIFAAERTYPGEDVSRPYLQGLEYNRILDAHVRQAALGWHATIAGVRDADGTAAIALTLADRSGAPLSGVRLSGILRHPMDEERDRSIVFVGEGNGRYVGRVAHAGAGRWDVVVMARSGHEPFEAKRRIWLH